MILNVFRRALPASQFPMERIYSRKTFDSIQKAGIMKQRLPQFLFLWGLIKLVG